MKKSKGKVLSTEELNKLKTIELEMLIEIDSLCRRENIRYSLTAGSLLGAIRHHGFIPWDDDIDIMMLRDDYDRFVNCIQQNTSDLYVVDYRFTKGYGFPFCKVMRKNTKLIEVSNAKVNCPGGVFIDVFPIDNAARSEKKRKNDYKIMYLLKSCLLVKENYYFGQTGFHNIIRIIKKTLFFLVPKSMIVFAIERICRKHNSEYTGYIISMTGDAGYVKALHSADLFSEYTEASFENHSFMIISDYDNYLRKMYGDYMSLPPKELQIPHHFVCELDI